VHHFPESIRRRARARGDEAEGPYGSRHDCPERRASDSARDRAGAPADSPRGRRPVRDDRHEAHPAKYLKGRQPTAYRSSPSAARQTEPLKPFDARGEEKTIPLDIGNKTLKNWTVSDPAFW